MLEYIIMIISNKILIVIATFIFYLTLSSMDLKNLKQYENLLTLKKELQDFDFEHVWAFAAFYNYIASSNFKMAEETIDSVVFSAEKYITYYIKCFEFSKNLESKKIYLSELKKVVIKISVHYNVLLKLTSIKSNKYIDDVYKKIGYYSRSFNEMDQILIERDIQPFFISYCFKRKDAHNLFFYFAIMYSLYWIGYNIQLVKINYSNLIVNHIGECLKLIKNDVIILNDTCFSQYFSYLINEYINIKRDNEKRVKQIT